MNKGLITGFLVFIFLFVLIYAILFIVAVVNIHVGDNKSYSYKAKQTIEVGLIFSIPTVVISLALLAWYATPGQSIKHTTKEYSDIIVSLAAIITAIAIIMAFISIIACIYIQKDSNSSENKVSYQICLSCSLIIFVPIGLALTVAIISSLYEKKENKK